MHQLSSKVRMFTSFCFQNSFERPLAPFENSVADFPILEELSIPHFTNKIDTKFTVASFHEVAELARTWSRGKATKAS